MNRKRINRYIKTVKLIHSISSLDDLKKKRQLEEQVGTFFSKSREIYRNEFVESDILCEWTIPKRSHNKKKVIFYCHGGGYKTGSKEYARTITTKLANATSMEVLSFNYRLAPEHPFPASLEDALKIWNYLMYKGYGSKDVIVAGDSAGGHLALVLVNYIKKQKRLMPAGLVLLSPWTDLTLSGESYNSKKDKDPILTYEYMLCAKSDYLGEETVISELNSPILEDYNNFIPTYIQVGANEILLSDSVSLYKKIVKGKSYAKIDIFKNMWHVFQMTNIKSSVLAIEKIADFIYDIV